MSFVTHDNLVFARAVWARTVIETYAFGLYTVMVAITLYHMFRRGHVWSTRRVMFLYTVFVCCVTTGWFYVQGRVNEAQSVEYLAGPLLSSEAAVGVESSATVIIASVLEMVLFFSNETLMLYRANMIFSKNRLIMAPLAVLFLAYSGLSITVLISNDPNIIIPNINAVGTTWYSVSALLNLLVTSMITIKLLLHRRRMSHSQTLASSSGPDVYISAIGMLVESAAPYTLSVIIFLPLAITNSIHSVWFEGVMVSMSFLAQALIILRTTMAQSIRNESVPSTIPAGSLVFGTRNTDRSTLANPSDSFVYKSRPGEKFALGPLSRTGTDVA